MRIVNRDTEMVLQCGLGTLCVHYYSGTRYYNALSIQYFNFIDNFKGIEL